MTSTKSTRLWLILSSLLLWIVSLCVPALAFHENPGPNVSVVHHSGFEMMFASIFGPFELNFAILANPLLLISWILLGKQKFRATYITLGFALFFALQTFQLYVTPFMEDEGGSNKSYLTHPLIGWYLWMAAIILPFAAAIHFHKLAKNAPPPPLAEAPTPA